MRAALRRSGVLALGLALAATLGAPGAAAHTDPTRVSPAPGSALKVPVSQLVLEYPERVSVFTVTVANASGKTTTKVSRKAASFSIPIKTGRGAWVAVWDTRMPDGDEVSQATTWRVGKLGGSPVPSVRSVSGQGVTLTVRTSDARLGAPASVQASAKGGKVAECWATMAGLDVPVSPGGSRLVWVTSPSVTCLAVSSAGRVVPLTVSL